MRPSPGAATSDGQTAQKPFHAFATSAISAPEDGRTPAALRLHLPGLRRSELLMIQGSIIPSNATLTMRGIWLPCAPLR